MFFLNKLFTGFALIDLLSQNKLWNRESAFGESTISATRDYEWFTLKRLMKALKLTVILNPGSQEAMIMIISELP